MLSVLLCVTSLKSRKRVIIQCEYGELKRMAECVYIRNTRCHRMSMFYVHTSWLYMRNDRVCGTTACLSAVSECEFVALSIVHFVMRVHDDTKHPTTNYIYSRIENVARDASQCSHLFSLSKSFSFFDLVKLRNRVSGSLGRRLCTVYQSISGVGIILFNNTSEEIS